MKPLLQRFREASFSRQLSAFIGMAVLVLALVSSLAASWQGSQQVRTHLLEQGQHIAENLARQSRLGFAKPSAESFGEAVDMALSFPDIVTVEVRRADGEVLLARNRDGRAARVDTEPVFKLESRSILESESVAAWHYMAPVLAGGADSPFETLAVQPEIVGYVRVVQSKETLARMRVEIFTVNFTVAFFLAFLILYVLRQLSLRLTRPLERLSEAMAAAEAGAGQVRARPAGPKDIRDMALAFNKMMAVLEVRERELRVARDNALKFAKLKADFAATVSHEIRTPLNGVVGTLDILMATEMPPNQRQFVEIAWDSSQYLLDLINNILDFSRLEAGKVELERTEFGVARLVEDVIELVLPQAMQKRLDLGYLVAPEIPARLLGDPRRLRQVLLNLISNSVKFTDQGRVEVRITRAADRLPAGGAVGDGELTICFGIVDTGIGIALDVQESIFDSFTQADTFTTRRFGGSGLGLAICKQLVELMGGQIGVESAPGRGSRFWFQVPLAEVAGGELATTTASWKGQRALVADESDIARRFLEQALAGWGFECQVAVDADAAMAAIAGAEACGRPFHLVLLDTALAAAGTESLALRIRAEHGGGPRLILMNRYGAERVPGVVHADAYLAKPLRLERLLEAIITAIGGDGDSNAPEASPSLVPDESGAPWVLIVEDNRTNQAIARGMLSVLGCRTDVAENGQEGVLAFKRQPWDMILMDCAMPGMDGYEVTAAVRMLEEGEDRRTPIVAMTANVQPSDVEKCLASGMDDHLAKPLTLDNLAAKLRRWISGFAAVPAMPDSAGQEGMGKASEPIDRAFLGKLREALGSAIGQAIRPFLEDMPGYLEEMDEAAAAGNGEQLRRAAHAVKGAAGNLGAHVLMAVAREIEDDAEAGRLVAAAELLGRARAEYGLVQQALLAELNTEPARAAEDVSKGALVLVVDDDRSTRSALRYSLQRNGFSVEEAADGNQALALIGRMTPDVILMDALMPEMDGFTACTRLQELPKGKDIPVLMITALEDNHSIQRAFAAGASDYIAKPLNLAVVNQRVRRIVEANRAERYVRHLAFNDTLTGLPNRVLFADHLNRAVERAENDGASLAVLFLDLDRFKFVNDTLGHEIGDQLLKAVAGRIRNCVRAGDSVARLGGDEFTVLLDELSDPAFAANVAQKICRSVAEAFEIEGQEIFVSASIGISVYPTDGSDVSTLLRHADTAMYRAKRGSGGFQFYEDGMEASVSEHLRLDSFLRRALERDELMVYYQPKAETASGRVVGMEALLRWGHPQRGMISPLEFIPLAEETGLINPIGEWVLRTACAQTKQWLDAGAKGLSVAVNISGVQLKEPGFGDLVASVLRDTGLDPRCLTLEITESVLMEHAREAVATLHRLRSIGLRLEIDDFGTGYSSLAYLKRFPVDALKVDRTFTRDMTENPDDAALVSGIVALAHSLRLGVVAEGVETREQLDFLAGLGCDTVQGFLLAEPLPADEFLRRVLHPAYPSLIR